MRFSRMRFGAPNCCIHTQFGDLAKPVLCQVYFCDLSTLDHSGEGVAFSQNRCPFVGATRSRTLSMGLDEGRELKREW
jgi:hypothetical protein